MNRSIYRDGLSKPTRRALSRMDYRRIDDVLVGLIGGAGDAYSLTGAERDAVRLGYARIDGGAIILTESGRARAVAVC